MGWVGGRRAQLGDPAMSFLPLAVSLRQPEPKREEAVGVWTAPSVLWVDSCHPQSHFGLGHLQPPV